MRMDPGPAGFEEPRKLVAIITAPAASPGSDDRGASRAGTTTPLNVGQERTLAALEEVFPVRFVRRDLTNLGGVDGLLLLEASVQAHRTARLPQLSLPIADLPVESPRPRRARGRSAPGGDVGPVAMADDPALQRPLRGRLIPERATPLLAIRLRSPRQGARWPASGTSRCGGRSTTRLGPWR